MWIQSDPDVVGSCHFFEPIQIRSPSTATKGSTPVNHIWGHFVCLLISALAVLCPGRPEFDGFPYHMKIRNSSLHNGCILLHLTWSKGSLAHLRTLEVLYGYHLDSLSFIYLTYPHLYRFSPLFRLPGMQHRQLSQRVWKVSTSLHPCQCLLSEAQESRVN